jgi:molecular chaperone GrpE
LRAKKKKMGETNTEPREIPIQFEGSGNNAELNETAAEPDEEQVVERPDEAEPQGVAPAEAAAEAGAEKEEVAAAERAEEPTAVEVSDPLHELLAQVDTLTQERSTLYDQLLRRQAEFENYRKRIERERGETYQRARAEVLLEFLPVVDNLERALSSLENSQGDAEALRHGVELIHRQFHDALGKFGLEPVPAVGQTFDPHVHEAVTLEPTDKHEENTIIEEFQRGYRMGDKLLRPAKVKVAATPEK